MQSREKYAIGLQGNEFFLFFFIYYTVFSVKQHPWIFLAFQYLAQQLK